MNVLLRLLLCAGTLVIAASDPITAAEKNPAAVTTVTVGAFQFKLTAPWSDKGTTRPMVKAIATWADPADTGHPQVDAAFYHFGKGQGGSTKANIDRWKGQFQGEPEEQIEELEGGDQGVVLIFLKGTYLDGPMFGKKTPKEDHALLGAILASEAGTVFLKATAPEAVAEAMAESFRTLALSPFAQQTTKQDGRLEEPAG